MWRVSTNAVREDWIWYELSVSIDMRPWTLEVMTSGRCPGEMHRFTEIAMATMVRSLLATSACLI